MAKRKVEEFIYIPIVKDGKVLFKDYKVYNNSKKELLYRDESNAEKKINLDEQIFYNNFRILYNLIDNFVEFMSNKSEAYFMNKFIKIFSNITKENFDKLSNINFSSFKKYMFNKVHNDKIIWYLSKFTVAKNNILNNLFILRASLNSFLFSPEDFLNLFLLKNNFALSIYSILENFLILVNIFNEESLNRDILWNEEKN